MSESRRMLAERADPLFAELGPDATEESDGTRIDELGLPLLLVPESEGGFLQSIGHAAQVQAGLEKAPSEVLWHEVQPGLAGQAGGWPDGRGSHKRLSFGRL